MEEFKKELLMKILLSFDGLRELEPFFKDAKVEISELQATEDFLKKITEAIENFLSSAVQFIREKLDDGEEIIEDDDYLQEDEGKKATLYKRQDLDLVFQETNKKNIEKINIFYSKETGSFSKLEMFNRRVREEIFPMMLFDKKLSPEIIDYENFKTTKRTPKIKLMKKIGQIKKKISKFLRLIFQFKITQWKKKFSK